MKNVLKTSLVIALVAIIASPLMAEETKKKAKGKRRQGGKALLNQTLRRFEKAELTDEQKEKLAALAKDWQPKFSEISKAAKITKEQRGKMVAARKEGKKGKDLFAAADLTEAQQKAQSELGKLRGEFNKAALALLTDEQRSKVKTRGKKGKGDRKPKGERKGKSAKKKTATE